MKNCNFSENDGKILDIPNLAGKDSGKRLAKVYTVMLKIIIWYESFAFLSTFARYLIVMELI